MGDGASMKRLVEELRRCRHEVERLCEENGWLRYSASSFAALAERLNDRLVRLVVERREDGLTEQARTDGLPRDR
jgi:hypothetical protein